MIRTSLQKRNNAPLRPLLFRPSRCFFSLVFSPAALGGHQKAPSLISTPPSRWARTPHMPVILEICILATPPPSPGWVHTCWPTSQFKNRDLMKPKTNGLVSHTAAASGCFITPLIWCGVFCLFFFGDKQGTVVIICWVKKKIEVVCAWNEQKHHSKNREIMRETTHSPAPALAYSALMTVWLDYPGF